MIRTTDALIVRSEPLRETSRILVFFSRDFGKLVTLAKGVTREEGRFVSPLDSLTYNRIVFYERFRTGLHLLTQCDLLDGFLPLREELETLAYGFYFLELVSRVAQPAVKEERLFLLLLEGLRELCRKEIPPLVLARAFETKLLATAGFMPEVRLCVSCRRALSEWVSPRFDKGGFVCDRCQALWEGRRVSRGTVASLGYLAASDFPTLTRFQLSKNDQEKMNGLLEKFLASCLEEKPKSRTLLERVTLS